MSKSTTQKKQARFTSKLDLIVTPIVEGSLLTLSGLAAYATRTLAGQELVVCIAVFAATLWILTIATIAALRFAFPLRPGVYRFAKNTRRCFIWSLKGFLFETNLKPFIRFISPPFRQFIYKALGANIAPGLTVISGIVNDSDLITIGENATIGEDALILGHAISSSSEDLLILGRVTIGANAIVGARSVVMPGVTIGEGAVLQPLSYVPMNTFIPAGETWGGLPARNLSHNEKTTSPRPTSTAVVKPVNSRYEARVTANL